MVTTSSTTMTAAAKPHTSTMVSRHLVASAIVIDPLAAGGLPRVLLVWSHAYHAWIFPTAHQADGESLAQTALRAANRLGVHDAWLWRAPPIQPIPGLLAVDSPWRTYQIPAPFSHHPATEQPNPRAWHQHLDHLFIALADATAQPATANHVAWCQINNLPAATRPDIPPLAHAAIHHAAAAVYLSRVKNLAQDSSAEGWVFWILGWGLRDGSWWTSMGR
jgi:ADP-ribose pyrophosphatase YjhB (NUDIX family)